MKLLPILFFFASLLSGKAEAPDIPAAGKTPAADRPRVAFLGDSITYDGRWPVQVEAALRSSAQYEDAEIVNFGLPSETASGLSEPGHAGGEYPRPCIHNRLASILTTWRPTLVIAAYGMNDGIFQPADEARFQAWKDGIYRLKTSVEATGARIIFITPSLYKSDQPATDTAAYDTTLEGQSAMLVRNRKDGWEVIDIRPRLRELVAEAASRDASFIFAPDGIHPGEEGHRLIASIVIPELWTLLKLPDKPRIPDARALEVLTSRANLLKHAWLTRTGYHRPGIPAGLPVPEAEAQAAPLLASYRSLAGSSTPR